MRLTGAILENFARAPEKRKGGAPSLKRVLLARKLIFSFIFQLLKGTLCFGPVSDVRNLFP